MNPDELPPSLSSAANRSFDQENDLMVKATADAQATQQPIVDSTSIGDYYQDGIDDQVQPMSISGHFRGKGNSLIYDNNRGLNNSYGYDEGAKPLSISDVRQLGVSETSGGGNHYASDQPPSRKDVRGPQASQTGPSFTGNQISEEEALAGISLTAAGFKRIDPNAFQKDNSGI